MFSGYEFAIGLIIGFILSLYAIRYFEKHYPENRPTQAGSAPFMKKKQERRKPVVHDEAKEWLKEQDEKKGR